MIKPGNTKKYNVLTLGSILFAFTLVAVLSVGFSGWVVNPGVDVSFDAEVGTIADINSYFIFDQQDSCSFEYIRDGLIDDDAVGKVGTLSIPFRIDVGSKDKIKNHLPENYPFKIKANLEDKNSDITFFSSFSIASATLYYGSNVNTLSSSVQGVLLQNDSDLTKSHSFDSVDIDSHNYSSMYFEVEYKVEYTGNNFQEKIYDVVKTQRYSSFAFGFSAGGLFE